MNKVYAFDYMLTLFDQWISSESNGEKCLAGMTRLSALKLLFLASANKTDSGNDLLDTFNEFYAMPYGPVESDIYNAIRDDKLPSYKVLDTSIKKKNHAELKYDIKEYSSVKTAVEKLKDRNNELISYRASKLVDITHKWESWKNAFDFAQFMGINSYKMTVKSIRDDRGRCFEL